MNEPKTLQQAILYFAEAAYLCRTDGQNRSEAVLRSVKDAVSGSDGLDHKHDKARWRAG
jgi:hypothetical protein